MIKEKSRKETDCVCKYSIYIYVYVYIHTHIKTHSYQNEEEILMTINLNFCNSSCGYSWYLLLPSSNSFCIPSAFNKHFTSGSWLVGLTQTFILKGSRPLVVLPKLACNCPLILITGHGNAKKDLLYFRLTLPYLCGTVGQFLLDSQYQSLQPAS